MVFKLKLCFILAIVRLIRISQKMKTVFFLNVLYKNSHNHLKNTILMVYDKPVLVATKIHFNTLQTFLFIYIYLTDHEILKNTEKSKINIYKQTPLRS